jgi:amidase
MFDVLARRRPRPAIDQPRRLRIAVSRRCPSPGIPVGADVDEAVVATATLLDECGHDVREADPPYPLDLSYRWAALWWAGIAKDAARFDAGRLESRTRGIKRVGDALRATRLDAFIEGRMQRYRRAALDWFRNFDVLVSPVLTMPAVRVGEWDGRGWYPTALGIQRWGCTYPWNLARFPAASVPAALSVERLPIGVQLVAAPGGEDLLFALSAELERRRPWRRPPLAYETSRIPPEAVTAPTRTAG